MKNKKPSMEKKRNWPVDPPKKAPKAEQRTPDANVAADGQCLIPPHPESTRLDTGEPCDDGRADNRR